MVFQVPAMSLCKVPAAVVDFSDKENGKKRLYTGFNKTDSKRILTGLLLLGLCVLIGCTRPPELIGIDNPEIPVASVENTTKQKIFIATTRAQTETAGALFSPERSRTLGLASVEVSIPPTHQLGEIERPRQLPPDPRTEFAIIEPIVYGSEDAFVADMNKSLSALPNSKRDILVFVHGYNMTTSDAVLRLAQFAEDSDFKGVSVLFDWASYAKTTEYVYDLNSALIAREKVREIRALLDRTNAEGYDILAHSMGTLLAMEAMLDQSQLGLLNTDGKLENVILAAPDIDMDLFRSQLAQVDRKTNAFFVLISEDDKALAWSRWVAGNMPRVGAGDADELAKLGVTVVDLSEVEDTNSIHHSKFTESPEIVKLIGQAMNRSSTFDAEDANARLNEYVVGVPIRVLF